MEAGFEPVFFCTCASCTRFVFVFLNLVQDSIFTSCTRCNILNSSNETQQQRKQERPDKAIGLYTSDMAIKLTQVRQSV